MRAMSRTRLTQVLLGILAIVVVIVAGMQVVGAVRESRGDDGAQLTGDDVPESVAQDIPAWDAGVRLERIASGLDAPLGIVVEPGSGRRVVIEQGGMVRAFAGDEAPTTILDLSGRTSGGGERGLLGIAFSPDYARDGRVVVNLTDREGDTQLLAFQGTPGGVIDPASSRTLLTVAQPYENHNGGALAFGPDGYLYVGLGDGGSGNDPGNRAQDGATLLGKILRLDVHADGASPYAVPSDNPFVGEKDMRPEIWALGLRNPWRFTFDDDGALWVADVGQNAVEEVTRLTPSDAGANLGWRAFEGSRRNTDDRLAGTHTPPLIEYGRGVGCSITGGAVVTDPALPALAGTYLFGDYCTGRLLARRPDGTLGDLTRDVDGPVVALTSFGQDDRGGLYAVSGRGEVFRLAPDAE